MGNTTQQWKANYNPSRKKRAAQNAVKAHCVARRRQSESVALPVPDDE